MRLLRLRGVDSSSSDRVFRHARVRAVIVWLAAFTGASWMFFAAFARGWKVGYIFGGFALPFLALTLRFVTARCHPSNWLVRANESGLYVQYRSYLNYQLPTEQCSVVFLSYGEITSARPVRERLKVPDPAEGGTTQTQTLRYVELELSGDTASLGRALQAEQAENAPMQKRWYGKSSTLYRDYPVSMAKPPFLRIRWDVVPRASQFLNSLRQYTAIMDPVLVTQDFVDLGSRSPDEQKRGLQELAHRGEVLAAVYTARRLYGCSLTDAKQLVEDLRQHGTSAV